MAQRHSGYQRREEYPTPTWVTEALFPHILPIRVGGRWLKTVWEPACGVGRMSAVLSQYFTVMSTDLSGGIDFLSLKEPLFDVDAIVTNPPWGRSGGHKEIGAKFVEQALKLTKPTRGIVAMLFPVDYDCANGRRHLFAECPMFSKKVILTKRIVWFEREDGKAAPSSNHAWFIWDWRHEGPPTKAYGPERKEDDK